MLFVFETGFHYVALTDLEFNMKTNLALTSQKPICLCLLMLGKFFKELFKTDFYVISVLRRLEPN